MKGVSNINYQTLRLVAQENPEQLKNFIKEYRSRVEKFLLKKDNHGNTALHFAAYNKDSLQILTNEFRKKLKT
ncbi:hypothetical protein [Candidatus Lariskella endosymbiont of Hedychridium roseum]|uniref:hypothetical protein n=1 Tax=Candidatus Lariskella endosymbiont of Hedychridium roseum TaxID=3077949 RepID=UPI0030CAE646